jgi:hypothetical protein
MKFRAITKPSQENTAFYTSAEFQNCVYGDGGGAVCIWTWIWVCGVFVIFSFVSFRFAVFCLFLPVSLGGVSCGYGASISNKTRPRWFVKFNFQGVDGIAQGYQWAHTHIASQ